ncbi:uncharacterized protein VTP21DRAFT_6498 [Calcarisporiella thermophila]|uniref:uncharacterized protein n=1 Tax=Calcarisporiella thermophila TaxID=911321 RepID=UPI0037430A5A
MLLFQEKALPDLRGVSHSRRLGPNAKAPARVGASNYDIPTAERSPDFIQYKQDLLLADGHDGSSTKLPVPEPVGEWSYIESDGIYVPCSYNAMVSAYPSPTMSNLCPPFRSAATVNSMSSADTARPVEKSQPNPTEPTPNPLLDMSEAPFPGPFALVPAASNSSRPPLSYAALIALAIESSPQKKMTVSEIYDFFLTRFPYFKTAKCTWKNSIRHNLTMKNIFLRDPRPNSEPGKGGLWSINYSARDLPRKRRSPRGGSSSPPTELQGACGYHPYWPTQFPGDPHFSPFHGYPADMISSHPIPIAMQQTCFQPS